MRVPLIQEIDHDKETKITTKVQKNARKKCGYVLPEEEAVVSGWDADQSSTHVHRPRRGKIMAKYVKCAREYVAQ